MIRSWLVGWLIDWLVTIIISAFQRIHTCTITEVRLYRLVVGGENTAKPKVVFRG